MLEGSDVVGDVMKVDVDEEGCVIGRVSAAQNVSDSRVIGKEDANEDGSKKSDVPDQESLYGKGFKVDCEGRANSSEGEENNERSQSG